MEKSELLEELLRPIISFLLKLVEHAFDCARFARHAELFLDPALIITVKDQRLLLVIVSTEIV